MLLSSCTNKSEPPISTYRCLLGVHEIWNVYLFYFFLEWSHACEMFNTPQSVDLYPFAGIITKTSKPKFIHLATEVPGPTSLILFDLKALIPYIPGTK